MFFDESRDAYVISRRDGTIVDVNQAWLDLYGYTREDVEYLNVVDLYVSPGDRTRFRREVQLRGSIKDYECEQIKKDGTRMTCLLTSTAKEIKEQDNYIGYMGILRDVTEQRATEKASKQWHEALKAVYEMVTGSRHSFQSICEGITTSLRHLLQVSHVVVRSLDGGQSTTVAIEGEHSQTILSKMNFGKEPFALAQKLKKTQQFNGKLDEAFHQNGLFLSLGLRSYLGTPIKNSLGEVVGLIDVLDKKERTFSDREIFLVEIFVRYIANEIERQRMESQLRDAHKMKLLGQIAAGIAHEVRNPLSALMAVTEALSLELKDSKDYKSYVDHMVTQMERLLRLMEGLLDLGRPIESTNLHKESLIAICTSAADLWRKANSQRKGALSLTYPPEARRAVVLADSAKLQQVFFNLLNNAAQASDDSSEISMVVSKLEKRYVRVSVIDQGVGIREDHLPLVFEPFFTTKRGGTGLGLSIVKNIVELHGGSIVLIPNSPQPGCTVIVTLRFAGGSRV